MTKKVTIVGLLYLLTAFNVFAQDNNRITQLEQEIQTIKLRLSKLESMQEVQADISKPTGNSDGWKSQSSWRQLVTGMTPNDVTRILGEPARLNGGGVATWYYQNRGYVTFISDKLSSWSEPK
jgi:hypothetical protein